MLNNIKSIGKHSSVYIFSQLSLSALGFFLLPLFSNYLSPAQFGTYSLILSINSILTIFVLLGIHASLTNTYFDHKGDDNRLKKHISSLFWFLVIWSLFLFISISLFYLFFGSSLLSNYDIGKYIFFVLGISIAQAFNQFYGSLLRSRKKSISYALFINGNSAFTIITTIILLISFSLGVLAPLIALLFFNILFTFISIYNLFKKGFVGFYISYKEIINSLKFSIPFVPHLLSGFINRSMDKIILLKYASLSNLGIYAMGSQIGAIINVIFSGINMAWMPYFHELYRKDKEKNKKFFSFIGTYIIGTVAFLIFLVSIFSKEFVSLLLSESYLESYKIIPIIALSFLFFTLYTLNASGLFAEKKSKKIASSTITGAIINIILNFALIPHFGIYGAAFATLISQIVVVIVIYFQSINIYKFPFQYLRIGKIFLVFSIFYLFSFVFIFDDIINSILYKTLLVLLSIISLYFMKLFDKEEIKVVKNIFKKKKIQN